MGLTDILNGMLNGPRGQSQGEPRWQRVDIAGSFHAPVCAMLSPPCRQRSERAELMPIARLMPICVPKRSNQWRARFSIERGHVG
jgi:hypothetical protein